MKTIEKMKDLKGKVVVVRVDFNVPQKGGVISDDNRIVAALPTIKYLLSQGAKLVLLSHLGKIDFKKTEEEVEAAKKKNTLVNVATRLGELLGQDVKFSPATRGEELKGYVDGLKDGEVLLVQNTRYEKGETKNDPELSKEWASLGDAFVMDAFGSAHRAHASTYGIPEAMEKDGKQVALGYLMEKEVANLSKCVKAEDHPYVAILGGFKVSDKIKVIESLLKKTDKILIGGAMAYTFLKALGTPTGESPVEDDQLDYAKKCYETGKIVLPVDSKVTNHFDEEAEREIKVVEGGIPAGYQGMDIGPKTIEKFKEIIAGANLIFWNGPTGVFEQKEFQEGTIEVCKAIAENDHAFSVIGGGDSAAAAKQFGYKDKFSHVSTGGGASLEMIENDGHLPGIDVIGE